MYVFGSKDYKNYEFSCLMNLKKKKIIKNNNFVSFKYYM